MRESRSRGGAAHLFVAPTSDNELAACGVHHEKVTF
jgi:hypothetical protein